MYNSLATLSMQKVGGGSFFEGAQGFVVKDSHFVYNARTTEEFLEKFAAHTIEGAEFDSSLRFPPPLCHPGTRKTIIERMQFWLRDPCRTRRMLWLVGSAGVGKSAIMQTLAELESKSLFLVTLFFSALKGRNDASKVIITLAYQIAAQCPSYRDFVREKVTNNPKLLQKSITAQFSEFIVEPFVEKQVYQGSRPLLVILDGLDECKGRHEQCVILGLISFFTTVYPAAPLLWVVSSRPEAHLTAFLSRAKVASTYDKEEVAVDSDEACRDAERFLRAEFERIRGEYPVTALYAQWPLESDFTKLAAAGLGLFAYATTIIRFIEDPAHSNPIAQFQKVLNVIDKTARADNQVMVQLDMLYEYILSQVPADMLPDTKELLSHMIYSQYLVYDRTFAVTCNWLGMVPDVGYSSVHWLHSVLSVPLPQKAESQTISFHHKSFPDYLRKTERSGMLTWKEEEEKGVRRALRILKDVSRCELLVSRPSTHISLCWAQDSPLSNIRDRLYKVASDHLNSLPKSLDDLSLPDVVHALGVMNQIRVTEHLIEILFDDDSPAMHKLKECGVIQDIPLIKLDFNNFNRGRCAERLCPHSEAECGDQNVECPPVRKAGPCKGSIWSSLEQAKAASPDKLVKIFIGNQRQAWVEFRDIPLGYEGAYKLYLSYNF